MLGYTKGGTQIQQFTSTGVQNFGYNYNVTLIHNTFVHVTVIASNAAELIEISYSKPVLMDLTPPDIVYVYDGRLSSKCLNNGDVILKNNIRRYDIPVQFVLTNIL